MLGYIIIVVVLAAIVYILYRCRKHDTVHEIANKSAGGYDKSAKRALNTLNKKVRLNSQDRFLRGRLIKYNYLNDAAAVNRAAALEVAINDHAATLIDMEPVAAPFRPEYILDRVVDFRNELTAADIHDAQILEAIYNLDRVVVATAPAIKAAAVHDRLASAVAASPDRITAVDAALEDAAKITTDAQNVHDTKLNRDLRGILIKLRQDYHGSTAASFAEAREYIKENDQRGINARITLDAMENGMRMATYNDTEDRIFSYVWERCKDPLNNRALMQDAVVDALADSVNNGSSVCASGRCARIINSLVTLDYDNDVASGGMTADAYKSQIYKEVRDVIDDMILSGKDDPASRADAIAYETGVGDVSKEFTSRLRQKIVACVDKYSGKFTQLELNNILDDCIIYAMI
jgi:hypothetical protein